MKTGILVLTSALGLSMTALAEPPSREALLTGLFADAGDPFGPGCAMSVWQGGKAKAQRTWGQANLEQPAPNTAETVFEAGSVSKQFTAAAIASLAAEGRLGLDDDIRRFLPEMRDYGSVISVRMLLNHTSGVRNWDDLVELAGRPREDASGYSQAEVVALIAKQSRLNFSPGSEYLYSNSNYVLLAAIVERVAGMSFQAYSEQALFLPAGMTRTRWRDDYTRITPGRATAYTPDDSGRLHIDMPIENVVGAGGLLTTVEDLQRWNAFLDNPSGASRSWALQMSTSIGKLNDGSPIAYGMGLEHDRLGPDDLIGHAGATAGYRAYLGRVPGQDRLSLALLCNAGALNTEDLGPKILSLFVPTTIGDEPAVSGRGAIPKGLDGSYRNRLTGARVDVTTDKEGARFNGGVAFLMASKDKMTSRDGRRTAMIDRNPNGAISRIVLSRVANSPVELLPVEPWTPGPSDLSTFVGSYHSNDVSADWTIAVEGRDLRATGSRGETFLLDPIYADAFEARDAAWTLRFGRDDKGAVASVSFTKTRTRDVIFNRSGG